MAESNELRQVVERAVAQVLDLQLPKLQADLVERVLATLPAATATPAAPTAVAPVPGNLVQSVGSIHAGTTQKEILRALLDAGSSYAARLALFVVKAGAANGWQCRGLGNDDAIKDFALDLNAGPVAHSYQNRIVTPGNIAEMDGRFVDRFGGPANEQIMVLPLVLKDKVAALLYADGGSEGLLDASSLELLVMATSSWLEVTSLRKQAQKEISDAAPTIDRAPAAPVQSVSSFADPFAAHVPKHIAPKVPEPEPAAAEVVEVAAHTGASAAASAPAAAADPFAGMSAEDADTHRKAQRFARLLVDEIKLYNQAKVAEGRRHKDLYDRLKEDIEKSRSTYQKRYGSTVAASGDYFQKEVVRSLAEEDVAIMGANFRH
jgi:hypothetical protein